jgi:hypothetical protein
VPHRVLLLFHRRQQVHVLPSWLLHQRNRRPLLPAVPRRDLLHTVCRRLEHNLRGVPRRLLQLQAWVNRVHTVSRGAVHRQDPGTGLQGLSTGHLQHHRGQLPLPAMQIWLHHHINRCRRFRGLQRQGAAGRQRRTHQGSDRGCRWPGVIDSSSVGKGSSGGSSSVDDGGFRCSSLRNADLEGLWTCSAAVPLSCVVFAALLQHPCSAAAAVC